MMGHSLFIVIAPGSSLQRVVNTTEIIKTDVKQASLHPDLLLLFRVQKVSGTPNQKRRLSLGPTKHNPVYGSTQFRTPGLIKAGFDIYQMKNQIGLDFAFVNMESCSARGFFVSRNT